MRTVSHMGPDASPMCNALLGRLVSQADSVTLSTGLSRLPYMTKNGIRTYIPSWVEYFFGILFVAPTRSEEVTRLLAAASNGDAGAMMQLVPLVHAELRALAHHMLSNRRPGQTLQTTALVHEAYIKLIDQTRVSWDGKGHFMSVAARAMRSILVDYVRSRRSAKRGGKVMRLPFDQAIETLDDRDMDVIALDEALVQLADVDTRKSQVVELRFFGGLGIEEIAQTLGIGTATVERDWRMAKAWLHRELVSVDPR